MSTGQINDKLKEVLNIPLTERKIEPKMVKLKKQTFGKKRNKDYTKSFVWILLGVITVAIWTIIYNLIF
jgi:hypothetical protein